jgi:hypothetical protein
MSVIEVEGPEEKGAASLVDVVNGGTYLFLSAHLYKRKFAPTWRTGARFCSRLWQANVESYFHKRGVITVK